MRVATKRGTNVQRGVRYAKCIMSDRYNVDYRQAYDMLDLVEGYRM